MKQYFDEALALIATGTAESSATGNVTNPYTSPAKLGGDASAIQTGPYVRSGKKGIRLKKAFYLVRWLSTASPDTLVVIAEQDASQTPLALPAKMYELGNPWNTLKGTYAFFSLTV